MLNNIETFKKVLEIGVLQFQAGHSKRLDYIHRQSTSIEVISVILRQLGFNKISKRNTRTEDRKRKPEKGSLFSEFRVEFSIKLLHILFSGFSKNNSSLIRTSRLTLRTPPTDGKIGIRY
ncbi:hypothetical protein HZS_7922 [Henneguya salminicola]|nr:hypothetical protein HZS_7922 [Henneguya salminicola]